MVNSKIMGYARVSTSEQNLDRQIDALKKYVDPSNIITDKASGKTFDRPGYQALKGALGLREGDILYIKSIDRLSRNKTEIKKELEWFQSNGIRLMILDIPTTMIDIPIGQSWIIDMINSILIEVLSSLAEQERKIILERQREGIEVAKKAGKHLGRPIITYPDNWEEWYNKWCEGTVTAKVAMNALGMKKSSFYKLVKGTKPNKPINPTK